MLENAWDKYQAVIYFKNLCRHRHGAIVERYRTDYAMADSKEKWKVYPADLTSAHAILTNHTDQKAHAAEKKRRAEDAKKSKQKSDKPPQSEHHE